MFKFIGYVCLVVAFVAAAAIGTVVQQTKDTLRSK